IGGKLELQRLGALDVVEILIDQREDRDLPQIDLLPPREIEQQVQRPFPTVELEIERCVPARRRAGTVPAFGRGIALRGEEDGFVGHAASWSRLSRLAISWARLPGAPFDTFSARSRRCAV